MVMIVKMIKLAVSVNDYKNRIIMMTLIIKNSKKKLMIIPIRIMIKMRMMLVIMKTIR